VKVKQGISTAQLEVVLKLCQALVRSSAVTGNPGVPPRS
jgi:hypothetical protein